jgi:hypothetical protein
MPADPVSTITFSELRRLSFCNSSKLPQKVVHDGILKEWVGIGWIDIGKPPKGHKFPTVVDDKEPKQPKKQRKKQ